MKILLTTLEGNAYPIEISEDVEIINVKALCELETNIPANEMSLSHNGRPLNDDYKTLASYGIKDDDILVVQKIIGKSIDLKKYKMK
jgi:DNA damage-inducible protein 1